MSILRESRAQVIEENGWLEKLDEEVARMLHKFVVEESKSSSQGEWQPMAWEILFDLVGESFAERHFGDHKRNRKLLEVPYLVPAMRVELRRELELRVLEFLEKEMPTKEFELRVKEVCNKSAMLRSTHKESAHSKSCADSLGGMICADFSGQGHEILLATEVRHSPPLGLVNDYDRWIYCRAEDRKDFLLACRGRSLPKSVRRYVLHEVLYHERFSEECYQEFLRNSREYDGESPHPGESPTRSKTHAFVIRGVNEALESLQDDLKGYSEQQMQTIKSQCNIVLDMHYRMSGRQHGSLAVLMMMLLLDFGNDPTISDVMLLGMLEKLRTIIPSRASSMQIAQTVWEKVMERSPELASFVRRLIEEHRAKQGIRERMEAHLLVLEWVENSLVGCVRLETARFVWMHCLMPGLISPDEPQWDMNLYVNMCAHLFCLIGDEIETAQSLSELQRTARERPLQLKTKVIREALASELTL